MSVQEAQKTIESLPFNEKWDVIQKLWENLYSEIQDQETPEEHISIMTDRLNAYNNGNTTADKWENVKKRLLDAI